MRQLLFIPILALIFSSNVYAISVDDATKLLIHADGANGSTIFTDDSLYSHSVTSNGAQVDTLAKKFGTGSALFQGSNLDFTGWNYTSGDYLAIQSSSDWNFGSGNFTIDFWVNLHNTTTRFPMISYSDGTTKWRMEWDASDPVTTKMAFEVGSTSSFDLLHRSTWNPTADTWFHIAEVRDGNNWYTFVDGSLIGSLTSSFTMPDLTGELMIGRIPLWAGGFVYGNGNIDELRIVKGAAMWTGDFTPPDVPYANPVPEPVSLLLIGTGLLGLIMYKLRK